MYFTSKDKPTPSNPITAFEAYKAWEEKYPVTQYARPEDALTELVKLGEAIHNAEREAGKKILDAWIVEQEEG